MSGYPEMKQRLGNQVSHQLCPRAEIFRRDQGTVTDMESFKHMLRYNGKFTCNNFTCIIFSQMNFKSPIDMCFTNKKLV